MKPLTPVLAAALPLFASVALHGQALVRTAATSLALPAVPPAFGYTTERTLGNLSFDQPIAIVTAPGETDRLFVVEKPGRIIVVKNLGGTPTRSTFLDFSGPVLDSGEEGLLALAFHPDYATNGYFYVWYTVGVTTAAGSGRHERLARFRVSAGNPDLADAGSEQPLISQFDQDRNHNGGELKFGPDGYLYLSIGDEGGSGDPFANSQRIDRDFFSAILRLDVDLRPGSLPPNPHPAVHAGTYAIPPDNPFVGATSFNGLAVTPTAVRTEFWAVGLRNPFRMSFDPVTGELWAGDVGQGAREEIDLITRGANYGWNYREGFLAFTGTPPASIQFTNPIHDYPRSEGISVTGGLVYRGTALAQLHGAYLFADYGSGRIWSLRRTGGAPQVALLTTDADIVSFGLHPLTGDILLADLAEGSVRRLVYNGTLTGTPFPATLGATGAFSSLATLAPAAGVVEYALNVPFWSDHARKRRWFALREPAGSYGFSPAGNWTLPTGAVWIKHFDLETTRGNPASARRIETRFLVKTSDGVYGLSYRWNDAQTEATLVAEAGEDLSVAINEGGIVRPQVWRFPGRAECLTCHTALGGLVLSFNTRQLNRDHAFAGGVANQITALAAAGYLNTTAPGSPAALPALAAADDLAQPLEARARSYLDVNCAGCHQPGGNALGSWDARLATPLASAGIVNGPLRADGGDPANRVIVPGDPAHSHLLHRIAGSNGAARMPPLATRERNLAAEVLIAEWIAALAGPGRFMNLSGRATVGTGDHVLIPAFVVAGTGTKQVLIRAIGPTLGTFGVDGVLAQPVLSLRRGSALIATNSRWNTAPNAAAIRATAMAVGAFALPDNSADSAVLTTLDAGEYSAVISGAGNTTGEVLFEIYDADAGTPSARLVNTSVRAQLGANATAVVIPGLVIGAGQPRTVLIRAVGPGLAASGVADFLAQPAVTLYAGATPMLANTRWGTAANAVAIAATGAVVGAFALGADSADSAILAPLGPGEYTLHVTSANGGAGIVLVEIYEVP